MFHPTTPRQRLTTTIRPKGYWDNIANQRSFMDELTKKLNITDEWFKITTKALKQHGASRLLQKYDGSPIKLLKTVYPKYLDNNFYPSSFIYNWDSSKFTPSPKVHWKFTLATASRGHWQDIDNQRTFMDELLKKLKYPELSFITTTVIIQNGGSTLLRLYGSIYKLLTSIYPEYKEYTRQLIFKIMNDLKISKVEDILNIPIEYP